MNLIIGILLGVLGQALIFFQIHGSIKYQFLQDHRIWVILMGVPISWIFMESVKNLVIWSDGMFWPSRIIGFGIGIVVFSALSYFMFGEAITVKTAVCIALAIIIIIIQVLF